MSRAEVARREDVSRAAVTQGLRKLNRPCVTSKADEQRSPATYPNSRARSRAYSETSIPATKAEDWVE